MEANRVDVMIDIESLGTKPGCVILSIAAVPIGFASPVENFYERIDKFSCFSIGLKSDPSTVEWWTKQDESVREEAFSGTRQLGSVLFELREYLQLLAPNQNDLYIWGNGASFDAPIIEAAYEAYNQKAPWKYQNSLCYRTLKNLCKEIPYKKPERAHSALEDAKAQAVHLEQILTYLRRKGNGSAH